MVNSRKARKGAKVHQFFAGFAPLRGLIDSTISLSSTQIRQNSRQFEHPPRIVAKDQLFFRGADG